VDFGGELLRRVVILPEEGNTGSVKLLAVELYDDGLVVRWMRRPSAPPVTRADPVRAPGSGLSIADDRATEYFVDDLSAGAGRASFHGRTAFTPAVPGDARTLRVRYADEAEVAVELAGQHR
jgi:hypothetical protein